MTTEENIWTGSPSQVTNLGAYIFCGILTITVYLAIIGISYAVWRYLVTKNTRYELTSQRLKTHKGVFSRRTDEIELYRVKDSRFDQTFFLRLFGLGNVILVSSDATTPAESIQAVPDAQALREQVRNLVEDRRDQKRVRVTEIE